MEKDISEKQLENCNDVFADIYNGLIFRGEQILKEEDLVSLPTGSVTRRMDGSLREGRRDICKADRSNGKYRLIVGLENQTGYDNTMPERVMGYDFAAYEEQIREIRDENRRAQRPAYQKRIHDHQKLAPSITTVLNLGSGEWKGPKDLHDMLHFPEEIADVIRPCVANYPLHVISVGRLTEEERGRLKSDFRLVAEYLAHRDKEEAFQRLREEDTHSIRHPEELLEALACISGDSRYYELGEALEEWEKKEEEEDMTMCKLWDYVENTGIQKGIQQGVQEGIQQGIQKGIQQGIQEGIQQGEARLNELILLLIGEKKYEELERCAKDKEYRETLMEMYGLFLES